VIFKEGLDVAAAFFGEETVEAGVSGYFVEDFEGGGGAIGRGAGVRRGVEVFVEEVVGGRSHAKSFHGEFFALEFVGVAEVD